MIKIGFIDYYLDEWHANTYPEQIKKLSNGENALNKNHRPLCLPAEKQDIVPYYDIFPFSPHRG